MLLVAAEVAPAMVAVDVLFAVEMLPLLKDSREEVAGWEAAAEAIPTSLQVGRKIFRDHCSLRGESTDEGQPALSGFISPLTYVKAFLRIFFPFCMCVCVHA